MKWSIRLTSSALFIFVILFLTSTASAGLIANWTFETATPADLDNSPSHPAISANSGSGNASGVHALAATDWSTPAGNGSANSFSSNNWSIGDYYQFQVSSLGMENLTFSWDQTRSGAGPANFSLQYSTDGASLTNFFAYTVGITSWSSGSTHGPSQRTQDLSAISALDNDDNIYFRLRATSAPTDTAGASRIDNISISGSQIASVPEPSTFLLGLVGMSVFGVRQWHRRISVPQGRNPAPVVLASCQCSCDKA